jgi:hypothetical protein
VNEYTFLYIGLTHETKHREYDISRVFLMLGMGVINKPGKIKEKLGITVSYNYVGIEVCASITTGDPAMNGGALKLANMKGDEPLSTEKR